MSPTFELQETLLVLQNQSVDAVQLSLDINLLLTTKQMHSSAERKRESALASRHHVAENSQADLLAARLISRMMATAVQKDESQESTRKMKRMLPCPAVVHVCSTVDCVCSTTSGVWSSAVTSLGQSRQPLHLVHTALSLHVEDSIWLNQLHHLRGGEGERGSQ